MNLLRFLLRGLHGYRLLLVVPVLMTVGQAFADVLVAFPLKFIIDKLVNHIDPAFPFASSMVALFDGFGTTEGLRPGEVHTQTGVIAFAAAMVVTVGLARGAFSYGELRLASFVGHVLTARLRRQLFEHVQRLSLDWHGRQKRGDLVQRVTGNIADIEKLVIDGLVDLLAGALSLVGMMAVMLLFNWRFALLSVVVVPVLFGLVLFYTKSVKAATKRAARAAGRVADIASEDIGAITEVKAFTLEAREANLFQRHVDRYRQAGLRAGRMKAEFDGLVAIVLAVSTFSVVAVGSLVASGHDFRLLVFVVPAGTLTIGTLTVFLTYVKQLYQPMRDLSKLMILATTAASAAERIQEVFDEEPEVMTPGVYSPRTGRVKGRVSFARVAFGYVRGQPVLKGIDLDLEPGMKMALVGLSGSGKTTMVKLIPRFHLPWSGVVSIDGVDNGQYRLDVLRQNISLVLQDSVLFEGTIRENIAIGRPNATQWQITAAAMKAHLHETIRALPGGYDAHVREQGKNLSSGQRQRLAIARAILRDSPILILDEPTANLDVEAESEVMHAIDKLISGRTVIMISHRLSSLGHVDRIVVLNRGKIAESGTASELKQAGGVYARLLREQTRYSADGATAREATPTS